MGWFKRFKGEVGWSLVRYFLRSAARTDLATLYRRAEFWARLGYLIEGSRRRTLLSNLSVIFPDWDARRVRRTAGVIVRNLCRGMVDLLYYGTHPDELRTAVHTDDTDMLAEVQSAGRGSILVTGHVGAFPWVGMPFVWSGRPYGVVARDPHDRRLADLFDTLRARFGMISVIDMPPAKAARDMFRILRRGGTVMTAFDIRPAGTRGVEVEFLGRKTRMFSGMIRIAAKARVPLVPAYVLREDDGVRHRVKICPPIEVPREAGDEQSAAMREVLGRLAAWLTDVIHRHPEQWWWLHRRWRPAQHCDASTTTLEPAT